MHLVRAGARDDWEQIEKKWHEAEARLDVVGRGAHAPASDVGAALGLLAAGIGTAYRRLRDAMRS